MKASRMTKKTDAWMPLWIGDYLADTQHLTRDEHGAYLLLMMAYWRNGGPLIDDDRRLAAIVKASPEEWKGLRQVLAEFFLVAAGFWSQKRLNEELSSSQERAEKAASKAKTAAEARWSQRPSDAPSNAPSNAQAFLKQCQVPTKIPKNASNLSVNTPPTCQSAVITAPSNAPSNAQAMHKECPSPSPTSSLRSEVGERSLSQRGSRLPADWILPDEWAEWAKQARPDLIPINIAQRFADYWHGIPGTKGRKSDWLATWRNWVRSEKPPASHQSESFRERDFRIAKDRFDEAAGRHRFIPSNVIDITPTTPFMEITQ